MTQRLNCCRISDDPESSGCRELSERCLRVTAPFRKHRDSFVYENLRRRSRTTKVDGIFSMDSRNLLTALFLITATAMASAQQIQGQSPADGNTAEYFQTQPQPTPYFVKSGEPGPLLPCSATPRYAQDSQYELQWVKVIRGSPIIISIKQANRLPKQYSLDAGSSCQGCYNLQLLNVSFAGDNGVFSCQLTGPDGFSKEVKAQVVVLVRPDPPIISPAGLGPLKEGQTPQLECQSTGGNPPPRITWKFGNNTDVSALARVRNASDLSQATISTLTWPVTYRDNDQYLRCFVWNEAMGDETAAMEIQSSRFAVQYAPKVTVLPANPYSVEEQKEATLSCIADANPPARSYVWSYSPLDSANQVGKEESKSQNFTFQVTRQTRGVYTCTASNDLGNGQGSVQLDVQYEPKISFITGSNQSSSVVLVSENQAVSVTCQPDANPAATSIVWKGPNGQMVSDNAMLNLHSVSRGEAGNYTCTATNTLTAYGGNSTPRQGSGILEVKVKHAPGRAIISESEPAVVGGTVSLSCTADDLGAPGAQYRWKAPGQQDYEMVARAVYTIENIQLDKAGEYSCLPYNEVGLGQPSSHRLIIYQPAQMEDHLKPEDQKKEGEAYELVCSARGHPAPNITWYKDDEPIDLSTSSDHWMASSKVESSVGICDPSSASSQASDQCSYKVVGSLKWVEGIRWTDKGYISCRAYNGAGKEVESKTLLRIQHKPVIVNDPNRPFVAAELGQQATIECKASSNPEPLFRWTKGGQEGELTSSDSSISKTSGKQYLISKEKTNQSYDLYQDSLTIRQVEDDDFGEYQCRASNQLGDHSMVFKLVPKKKPQPPESFQATSDKTHMSIVLSWVPGFNGGYDQTFTIWQVDGDQSKNVSEGDATSNVQSWRSRRHVGIEKPAPARYNYTGLLPSFTYAFKIKAWNRLGETEWSDKISAMTADAPLDHEIKKPDQTIYNADTGVLEIRPSLDPGKYCALIYLRQTSGVWEAWNCASPDSKVQGVPPATNMRVRFCNLQTMYCGEPAEVMTGVGAGFTAPIIVTIVVAAVVLLALACVICFCCMRSRRQKQGQANGRNFLNGTTGSDKSKEQRQKGQKKQKKTPTNSNVPSRNGTAKKDYEMETNQARPKAISGPYLTKNTPGPSVGLGVDQNTGSSKDSGVFTTSSATNNFPYDSNTARNGNAYVTEPMPTNGHGMFNGSAGHHHHGQQVGNGNRPPSYDGHEHWGATDGYGLANDGGGAYLNGSANHHQLPLQQHSSIASRGGHDFRDGTAMDMMNGGSGSVGPGPNGSYYDGTMPTSAVSGGMGPSAFVDPYGAGEFVDMNPNGGGSGNGSGAGGDGSMNSGYSTPSQRRIMREIIV